MKATGIVRKVDKLGRIVLPIELRRTLDIMEKDSIELFLDGKLIYLLLAGTFACVGQLGITKAYVCAPAKEISVYDYTQVLFAAALGFFVFGEAPDWLSVLGYVLICGAGVGMFLYNRRRDAAHP